MNDNNNNNFFSGSQRGICDIFWWTGLGSWTHSEYHGDPGQDHDGFGDGAQRNRLYNSLRKSLDQRYINLNYASLCVFFHRSVTFFLLKQEKKRFN